MVYNEQFVIFRLTSQKDWQGLEQAANEWHSWILDFMSAVHAKLAPYT